MKLRKLNFQLPIQGVSPIPWIFTLSNLAGHSAFVCLAFSYLEKDIFYLRVYAATGITLSIIFQYYREKPLWIPIKWNFLFLAINTIMISFMLLEANEVNSLSHDGIELYNVIFHSLGMTLIDLLHLMRRAEKKEFKKGEQLITQGKPHRHLYIVMKGKLSVNHDGKFDYYLRQYQFVGELSYLSWRDSFNENNKKSNVPSLNPLSILSPMGERPTEPEVDIVGRADVICEEDCIVYRWSFQDLHDLQSTDQHLDVVLEKYLSADLFKKMNEKLTQEPVIRYKTMLSAPLSSGYVSSQERDVLAAYRAQQEISDSAHQSVLEELGWTAPEFDVGCKGGPTPSELSQYQALLNRELQSGAVTRLAKDRLKLYRERHRIQDTLHLEALGRVPLPETCCCSAGWTLDAFEAGVLTSVADAASTRTSYGMSGLWSIILRLFGEDHIDAKSSINKL